MSGLPEKISSHSRSSRSPSAYLRARTLQRCLESLTDNLVSLIRISVLCTHRLQDTASITRAAWVDPTHSLGARSDEKQINGNQDQIKAHICLLMCSNQDRREGFGNLMSKNRPLSNLPPSSAVPRSSSFTAEISPLYHSSVTLGELPKCFSKVVPTKACPSTRLRGFLNMRRPFLCARSSSNGSTPKLDGNHVARSIPECDPRGGQGLESISSDSVIMAAAIACVRIVTPTAGIMHQQGIKQSLLLP